MELLKGRTSGSAGTGRAEGAQLVTKIGYDWQRSTAAHSEGIILGLKPSNIS